MLQSHVIEIDGVFIAAAITQEAGFRFVAIDKRVEELDGSVWPTLADASRRARSLLHTGSTPRVIQHS